MTMTIQRTSGPRDADLTVRTRRPAGAVLSVRVPRDLAVAVDEFASSHKQSMSDVVREALEEYLTAASTPAYPTLYASTNATANLVLTSSEAQTRQPTRGLAQTENRQSTLAVSA